MSKFEQDHYEGHLESLLSIKMNGKNKWNNKKEAEEFIQRLIEAHCLMEGISKEDFLKHHPNIKEKLFQIMLEAQYITTQEGKCLSKLDFKTLQERKTRVQDMKKHSNWKQWGAYKKHLLVNKKFSEQVIENIDKDTDNILAHVPIPKEEKEFTVTGICMGPVQAGKTMNYAGLINKLIDIGYDITIILAGIPSSLRNQTQCRIEKDVVGIDTITGEKVGIGSFLTNTGDVEIYTKQDNEDGSGDFNLAHIKHLPIYQGNKQIVIVTKKNPHILSALIRWLTSLPFMNKGVRKLERLSLALIDDECDNASLNIEKEVSKRSSINQKISDILGLFHKKVFIGYSASPFANIYLDPNDPYSLFPNDFMYLLKPPSNYLGPIEFFGVKLKKQIIPGMPLVRVTDDLDASRFRKGETVHDWNYESYGINPSLKVAINSFILSGAIRILRGQGNEHHSMMVHNSVRVKTHEILTRSIQNYIDEIKQSIKVDQMEQFWDNLLYLWEHNFIKTSKKIGEIDSIRFKHPIQYDTQFSFSQLKTAVIQFMTELEDVREINGKSEDELDFHKTNKKLKVICVGGAILSRGYTIEGLVCSYYMRNSIFYDTVLQAMRFAGYKPHFRDLVRVFTSSGIKQIFEETAKAVYMLSAQLEDMEKQDKTPRDFGLFIETKRKSNTKPSAKIHPQNSHKVDPNFSGASKDVAAFLLENDFLKHNYEVTNHFINQLGAPTTHDEYQISWRNADTKKVIEFFSQFKYSRFGRFRTPILLNQYLEEVMFDYNSTKMFDVVIPLLNRGGTDIIHLGSKNFSVQAAQRSGETIPKEVAGDGIHHVLSGGRALTSRHLVYGLSEKERDDLFSKYPINQGQVHTESQVREFRKDRGQLVLYAFCKDFINNGLKKYGESISYSPIGFHFNIPVCEEFEDREQITNNIYYWNEILGGNVK